MEKQYSPDTVAAARGLQTYTYIYASMVTFWVYDYVCSLDMEWTFLLQSRWTKVKGLYVVTRYAPFLFLIGNLYMNFSNENSMFKCQTLNTICEGLSIVSAVCSESFFILRTHALWNNNRLVLAAMLFTFFAVIVASVTVTFTSTATAPFQTSGVPGITGCYQAQGSSKFFIPYLLLFILELVILSFTLIRAIQCWWMTTNVLYAVLLKHNIWYYVCGLFFSGLNVVTSLILKYAYNVLFDNFQFIILAILATRMHLYLWHTNEQLHGSDGVMIPLSDISYASTSVT